MPSETVWENVKSSNKKVEGQINTNTIENDIALTQVSMKKRGMPPKIALNRPRFPIILFRQHLQKNSLKNSKK